MTETPHNPTLHRLAIATACATFPLIFMGGLVTSHQAGMSVPDWPNSYGYNMFLFPPHLWVQGIFYEHTHRLMGTVVGFCSILLVLWAWGPARRPGPRKFVLIGAMVSLALTVLSALAPYTYNNNESLTKNLHHAAVGFFSLFLVLGAAGLARTRDERRWVRWLSVAVLIAVIFQGVLGGLRVVLVELDLAIVHACFAQAFFCLTALMIAVTSRWWTQVDDVAAANSPLAASHRPNLRGVFALAAIGVGVIYLQLIAGAVMRHYNAGLAIPDLPLAYGKFLPPTDAAGLDEINRWRTWQSDASLERVTLTQVWSHFSHRIGAILVTVAVVALLTKLFRKHASQSLLFRPAFLLSLLLVTQLTLGVLTVLMRKPADIASLHVAFGALTLVTTFVIAVRAYRLSGAQTVRQTQTSSPELRETSRFFAGASANLT